MLNFIVPKFIKTFDRQLLLNRPFWYICKLHYILYFTLLMWALSFLIGNLLPIEVNSYDPMGSEDIWIFTFSVLGVILFCVWMYHLTIYNNEDHYGRYSKFDDIKFLAVFMIGINLLMSFSYPMQLRMKTRLSNVLTDKELAEQYNTLNLSHKYLTRDINDFQYCGYDIHKQLSYNDIKNDTNAYRDEREIRDLSKYKNFKAYYPGVNDFEDFNFSTILFGKSLTDSNKAFDELLLSAQQIETYYQNHTSDRDIIENINKTLSLSVQYGNTISYSSQDYLINYQNRPNACLDYMPSYSFLPENDENDIIADINIPVNFMDNIYDAKFKRTHLLSNGYLIFAFYFSFIFSLLMILFRNNRWQHYLVTAVSFILIGIILSIFSMLLFGNSFGNAFPTLVLLTWLTGTVIAVRYYFNNAKYNVVGVVCSNLLFITLPFFPFIFGLYLHEVWGLYKCEYINITMPTAQEIYECDVNRILFEQLCTWTQILGIAFFVIVALPLFKQHYIKQKALPKEK